ncbi:MAG: quinolinate synthase NadA [Methanoculleus sp.]|uniref:quinolinate synthase NadA n=1 Tax=unclassified Methanoculleus TaxID=2619537 RepID=UPI0025DC22CA|nr:MULTISPECIES: quinolinate synthase NadA [unclassified Methanoculleus]MCK9317802.1 quinolinate synthase NadA [Methanoculleus sp.]MDD2255091.1 quinolinate synthase NadA [Methanoculleus sp.]MDD3217295.1 quinolinate synthase NadA [Methanoculleus sp.]MDD4315387.1 quinolinate synthase NadA [Methanoculleus sp.]MDD4472006.1 quinolinate synthase NadA [Methanoculleus sp.]
MSTSPDQTFAERIVELKEEKSAVILAHNYQIPEVQEVADLVGDSLELARAAATIDADVIVFCGVDFMAETAAILSPEKTVVLPAADACCPMAEMVTAGEVRVLRERFPEAAVVAYVNTSAAVKAESDICCTSANAVAVVESLDAEQVIFLPDRNLGRYVARFTKKEILPWEGYCIVHDRMTADEVTVARRAHPNAEVLVHPECRPEVIDLADHVFSTSGMVRHACSSPGREFVIGTEVGILHQLEKKCPEKVFYPLSNRAVCVNMKKTDLAKVLAALEQCEPRVTVPEDTAARARTAIQRMLDLPR